MSESETQMRTVCDCAACRVGCRTKPGALLPGDLQPIAQHFGPDQHDPNWLQTFFRRSTGAQFVVRDTAAGTTHVVSVPSIVPAQRADGSCVFLSDNGLCQIHAVAPYGCAFFDTHMAPAEAAARSKYLIQQQARAHYSDATGHQTALEILHQLGAYARPLHVRNRDYVAAFKAAQVADLDNAAASGYTDDREGAQHAQASQTEYVPPGAS